MRMIAVFEKSERLRHIGHLDIQRFVQRGLRRSGLPVAYSNGFNPHILVTFASALSTGACGKREIMDVTMAAPVSEADFLERMNRAMPPDMQLSEARSLEDRHPALMATLQAASYDILIRNPEEAERLQAAVAPMMAREQVTAIRKTKSGLKEVDIKPLIYALNGKGQHLYCTLALTEGATCKPGMLLEALCREAGIGTDDAQEQDGIPTEAAPAKNSGEAAEQTDSFGNRVEAAKPVGDRNGPVRVLVIRTALLGTDENGALVPLERL